MRLTSNLWRRDAFGKTKDRGIWKNTNTHEKKEPGSFIANHSDTPEKDFDLFFFRQTCDRFFFFWFAENWMRPRGESWERFGEI